MSRSQNQFHSQIYHTIFILKIRVIIQNSRFWNRLIMMPTGSAGKEIPEEEYRTVFREMFENVGLPAKKLDEIELNYTPSIW